MIAICGSKIYITIPLIDKDAFTVPVVICTIPVQFF